MQIRQRRTDAQALLRMPDQLRSLQRHALHPAAEGHLHPCDGQHQRAVRQGDSLRSRDALRVQRVCQGNGQAGGGLVPVGLEDEIVPGVHGRLADLARTSPGHGCKGQVAAPLGQSLTEFLTGQHLEYLLCQEGDDGLLHPMGAQPGPRRHAVFQPERPIKPGMAPKAPPERCVRHAHAPADIPDRMGQPPPRAVTAQGLPHRPLEQVKEMPQGIAGLLRQFRRGDLRIQGGFDQVKDALHGASPPFVYRPMQALAVASRALPDLVGSIACGWSGNLAGFALCSINFFRSLNAQHLAGMGIHGHIIHGGNLRMIDRKRL